MIGTALLLLGFSPSSLAQNYTLAPAALDYGGGRATSSNYTVDLSNMAGGVGSSENYTERSGFAGQLFDVEFTPPVSLVADGTPKIFTAVAAGVGDLILSYQGRGFTIYDASSEAPSLPGLYQVTASSAGDVFTVSATVDFVISGPVAVADALTKPLDNSDIAITLPELLANDFLVLPDGSVTSTGLLITGVTAGPGNRVFLGEDFDAGWIFFMPSVDSVEAFAYVISGGVSTANSVVTVTALSTAPPFNLQIVRRGSPVFDGSRTTLAMDFIGVPGQDYQVEWSTDLAIWLSGGTIPTGLTGSFTVNLSLEGDHLSTWNQSMFFRTKR